MSKLQHIALPFALCWTAYFTDTVWGFQKLHLAQTKTADVWWGDKTLINACIGVLSDISHNLEKWKFRGRENQCNKDKSTLNKSSKFQKNSISQAMQYITKQGTEVKREFTEYQVRYISIWLKLEG
jgi:hypothetical protein